MRYYIESDGRIFLIRRDGKLDLPEPQDVPFDVDVVAELAGREPTCFCVPRLDRHPATWPSKDAVQNSADVSARVLEAVHATMPRVVCEAVCIRDGRILLAKGNRGFTKDLWTLPGGFVRFGEHPADALRREIREELGVDASIGECLAMRSKLGKPSRLHWLLFFYRAEIIGEPVANPDEIAEIRFLDPKAAVELLSDRMMAEVVDDLPDSCFGCSVR